MKEKRQILFRGKDKATGEWVYGYYVHFTDYLRDREIHLIFSGSADTVPTETGTYDFFGEHWEVDPKTVGQYVCLDRNGNKIFEDDVLKTRVTDDRFKKNPRFMNFVISYSEKNGRWENGSWVGYLYPSRLEVLGNIHDNPDITIDGR